VLVGQEEGEGGARQLGEILEIGGLTHEACDGKKGDVNNVTFRVILSESKR
jgi:hypothetical protein